MLLEGVRVPARPRASEVLTSLIERQNPSVDGSGGRGKDTSQQPLLQTKLNEIKYPRRKATGKISWATLCRRTKLKHHPGSWCKNQGQNAVALYRELLKEWLNQAEHSTGLPGVLPEGLSGSSEAEDSI